MALSLRVAAAGAAAVMVLAGCSGGGEAAVDELPSAPALDVPDQPGSTSTEDDQPVGYLGEITHPSTGPCTVEWDPESGRAWVSYANSRQITEVDTATGETRSTLTLEGTRPCLMEWIDGALWVGVFRDSVVQKIDPETGEISAEVPLTGNAWALLSAFDHLWILDRSAPAVRKIDPATGEELGSVRVEGSPRGLVATEDGVWLVRERPGVITRIDPDSVTIAEEVAVEPGIRGIVATDDALWVTRARVGTVHRIDLATREVSAPIVVGEDPRGISVAAGSLWVGDVTGALVRVDIETGQLVTTVPFAVGTGGAAPIADQLWVFEPNRIVRIDPAEVTG